ncbi:TPA: hypothetical protein DDW35_10110 [Candidatus Sumerlaeota bacterium]|nr:hypothetical protein [Candidatus Sumerlaeota bacterium]
MKDVPNNNTVGLNFIQTKQEKMRKGQTLVLAGVTKYELSTPGVVDCQPGPESHSLLIIGRGQGETELVYQKEEYAGLFKMIITIGEQDIRSLLDNIKTALGGIIGIKIRQAGEIVELQGDIIDRYDGQRIDRQLERYGKDILDMTERIYLKEDLEKMTEAFKRDELAVEPRAEKSPEGYRRLVLYGTLASDEQNQKMLHIAKQYFLGDKIVVQVRVSHPQIAVTVENYAINMNKAREVGQNDLFEQITQLGVSGAWTFATGANSKSGGTSPSGSFGGSGSTFIKAKWGTSIASQGSAQTVQVREGETGEIRNVSTRIFKITTQNTADVKELEAGQILKITPKILEGNVFEVAVASEISSFYNNDATGEGRDKSSVTTTFRCAEGESILLGGSRAQQSEHGENRTPFLGRIPVIKLFFKNSQRRTDDKAYVSVMTIHAPQISTGRANALDGNAIENQTKDALNTNKKTLERKGKHE